MLQKVHGWRGIRWGEMYSYVRGQVFMSVGGW